MTKQLTLEDVVIALIFRCRDRCGAGFGNYPFIVREIIGDLLPLVNQDALTPKTGDELLGRVPIVPRTIKSELALLDERIEKIRR